MKVNISVKEKIQDAADMQFETKGCIDSKKIAERLHLDIELVRELLPTIYPWMYKDDKWKKIYKSILLAGESDYIALKENSIDLFPALDIFNEVQKANEDILKSMSAPLKLIKEDS